MSETAPQPDSESKLESGTYEILQNRLRKHADELRSRLAKLNEERKQVFGSIELKLLNTERITTENNCIPRDMIAVGDQFLFGYNVQFGLKSERSLSDVFGVYEFDNDSKTFSLRPLDLIRLPAFEKDFQDVYRYYKNATFEKFFVRGVHLYMVFRVGRDFNDIKSFKWLMSGGALEYLGNRSDHEVRYPPQHEFEWIKTTRDMQRHGLHPHISVEDKIFVETVGGDLTIKVEDNTESGKGVYEELVENSDQTLDDADIYYAFVGHTILLKIRPYQETVWRYIVFNEKTQKASRVDSIADSCVLLPDDQGLIFSNGYYLQSGEQKTFETSLQGLIFERRVVSPNGEDTLYVFYQPKLGDYVLLGYNVIEQKVDTPIVCHGFTMFQGGEMILQKSQQEAQKHHAIQVWQTPYVGEDYQAPTRTDSYLYKIGNRDIVRAMAECHEILGLVDKDDRYTGLYVDLEKRAIDVLDSYFWINQDDAFNLAIPLQDVRKTAAAAVDEYEKVVRVRKNTRTQTDSIVQQTRELLNRLGRQRFETIEEYVQSLSDFRRIRGDIIGLRELRYADLELIASIEKEVAEASEQLSHRCVNFLLQDDALSPYVAAIEEEQAAIDRLERVAEAREVESRIADSADELEMLIEIVSNLKIDDATQRTSIIDKISAIFSRLNTARATLKRKTQELASVEGAAEFSSQLKLLNQSVVNYLDVCDTPQRCEEYLTKLMVQLEELEGKFAEFDEFILQLTEKREEIASAFESRRMLLVEKRNRRANALADAADRILKGVKNRVDSMDEVRDIHGYFASDLMIEKVRNIVADLEELGDSVKVDDIQSKLKSIRDDSVRQLKDRKELYEDGDHVIRFGNHRFSVNTQVLDLTLVFRDGEPNFHLTGTDFYEPIGSAELRETEEVWSMEVISENANVYRAEYLAYQILLAIQSGGISLSDEVKSDRSQADEFEVAELLPVVQRFMGPRYREGYTKGVHDHDAAIILQSLLKIHSECGLLRYSPQARAIANLYWWNFGDSKVKKRVESKLSGFGVVSELFPGLDQQKAYISELQGQLWEWLSVCGLFTNNDFYGELGRDSLLLREAAEYLFEELTDPDRKSRGNVFVTSQTSADLFSEFHKELDRREADQKFADAMKAVSRDTSSCFELARDWITAFLINHQKGKQLISYRDEVAELIMDGQLESTAIVSAQLETKLEGMTGSHPVISNGVYQLQFHQFNHRLARFASEIVPKYERFHALKKQMIEAAQVDMQLEDFQPRVLTSFVRNKLIDQVYLPLIGDNLAKQIGTSGEGKRTDRQGLLLLISPPGYGKTTLMEYIANRLGIIFMKINGPALGHEVTSLDPNAAPNAGAREEIDKLNLAFEMGDNVMIYLDDIQHCHPEFLQKFISLCDAQRKIEGVYKGVAKTYDFRGKKVAVVMAGNPYTESGEKFRIPDMLSNRADIYNLGEIIGDSARAFELSYIENALTSNPVLTQLASRSQKDVHAVVELAERVRRGEEMSSEGVEFESNYSIEELNEFVQTMTKLMRARDVVLKVNQAYIASAAQNDDYRTEPPFLLQGSYRNMNRIAEKVMPIMDDAELETLIDSSYQNDAQTLTSGTEANLLKFRELNGTLTASQNERWEAIKKTFRQNVKMKGIDADDKVGQVILTINSLNEGLDSIRSAVVDGATALSKTTQADPRDDESTQLQENLQTELRTLSGHFQAGLQQLAQLVDRPLNVSLPPIEIPPLEVQWPQNLPVASTQKVSEPSEVSQDQTREMSDRITVVNKLPRSVYGVLESQFSLMQEWMKPLTEMAVKNQGELSQLVPMVEQCLKDYRKLLRNIESAKER
ncbi:DNA repair ATPase [Thalassoglobus sp. JC818]|uniref:DNA repair ATPase n=1 Tax=Thalassoglobus sp. JC818 TaxID=3232136 RepID=UPI003458FA51